MTVVSLGSWRQEDVLGQHFIEMSQMQTSRVNLTRSLSLADDSAASP